MNARANSSDFWTEEKVGDLIRLDKDGLSALEIAKAIGAVSRNAVIAKLHRLGITNQSRAARRMIGMEKNRKKSGRQASPFNGPTPKLIVQDGCRVRVPFDIETVKLTGPMAESLNLSILHPAFDGCRWPTVVDGDGVQRFCCLPVSRGSYCAGHAAKAYPTSKQQMAQERQNIAKELRRFA